MQTVQQVELFKTYALELVDAAITPLRVNTDIMEGGCECISGIEKQADFNPFDVALAIMSIGKNYYDQLRVIRKTANLSTIPLDVGLMKNIRTIVAALEVDSSSLPYKAFDINEAFKPYLLKHKQGSSDAYEENLKSVAKCYRTMLSIRHADNGRFFEQLAAGFEIARALIDDDDESVQGHSRWHELFMTIIAISKRTLSTVDFDYSNEQVAQLIESLYNK